MANSYEMLVNARRLRDLPLERDAVGALCGHGFHPLKAQLKVQRLPVLALSQVTTAPEAVATRFDRVANQVHVAQLLRAGCAYMRKAFDIEDINLDELIATAMDDPQAIGESKAFHGINFADLLTAYREFYNRALKDLPDHTKLKGLKLPGESVVLDRRGERFAEIFEENQRRIWVVLADIPEHVQKAFIAAAKSLAQLLL
jgi:penicillin-binding protein 1A